MTARILIVDDEELQRQTLAFYLEKKGYDITTAASAVEAVEMIGANHVDIIISDQKMPGMSGLELAAHVKVNHPNISVVIITAFGSIENAVSAMKDGVEDYITKPVNLEELSLVLEKIIEKRQLVQENRQLKDAAKVMPEIPNIVYGSEAMEEVMSIAVRAAETNATVLVNGESGTGKELVARAVHELSVRNDGPFIAVNCAAIPESLIENELFGHEKGAFTGADRRHQGKFEQADKGTLFLDEIGEIPAHLQVKLLRVLQERNFQRVGGEETLTVDVRIIAATNRDLESEVSAGTFREDLFYRLNVIGIEIPPLRKRRADIPALVEHFIALYAGTHEKTIESITPEALDHLVKYQYPGNIRELGNIVEQAVVLARGNVITAADLPPRLAGAQETAADDNGDLLKSSVQELEKKKLYDTLEKTKGNKSAAARILGVSEGKVRYLLKKYEG